MTDKARPAAGHPRTTLLMVGALGIVFGDIGTSPLYSLRQAILATDHLHPELAVTGVLSLITWAIIIAIAIKYVGLVLRVDNEGEGGILALATLLGVHANPRRWSIPLLCAALVGAAMLFGDGIIAPVDVAGYPSIAGQRRGIRHPARSADENTRVAVFQNVQLILAPAHRVRGERAEAADIGCRHQRILPCAVVTDLRDGRAARQVQIFQSLDSLRDHPAEGAVAGLALVIHEGNRVAMARNRFENDIAQQPSGGHRYGGIAFAHAGRSSSSCAKSGSFASPANCRSIVARSK